MCRKLALCEFFDCECKRACKIDEYLDIKNCSCENF